MCNRPISPPTQRPRHEIHHGEDSLQGVREQGDADPDAGAGRRGQDHDPLQAQAGPERQHHPHSRLQRRDGHLQEC